MVAPTLSATSAAVRVLIVWHDRGSASPLMGVEGQRRPALLTVVGGSSRAPQRPDGPDHTRRGAVVFRWSCRRTPRCCEFTAAPRPGGRGRPTRRPAAGPVRTRWLQPAAVAAPRRWRGRRAGGPGATALPPPATSWPAPARSRRRPAGGRRGGPARLGRQRGRQGRSPPSLGHVPRQHGPHRHHQRGHGSQHGDPGRVADRCPPK